MLGFYTNVPQKWKLCSVDQKFFRIKGRTYSSQTAEKKFMSCVSHNRSSFKTPSATAVLRAYNLVVFELSSWHVEKVPSLLQRQLMLAGDRPPLKKSYPILFLAFFFIPVLNRSFRFRWVGEIDCTELSFTVEKSND